MSSYSKRKSGFTIVELVIALAIIVAVSFTALSVALSSVAAKRNAINKTEARSFANDTWECFKASESEEEFLSNVEFSTSAELGEGQTDDDGYTIYAYQSEENIFSATVRVKFSESARSEFAVEVTDKDGDNIISFSYKKGDGI